MKAIKELSEDQYLEIQNLSASRLFQLYPKFTTVNLISKAYSISKTDSSYIYQEVRKNLRQGILIRTIIYLVIGAVVGYVAYVGTFVQGNFILWGALLVSVGCLISGFCFLLSLVNSYLK